MVMATANAIAGRALGYAPMLTPGKVRELGHVNWVCDNAAIARDLAWSPKVSLTEGLRATPGWCPHGTLD